MSASQIKLAARNLTRHRTRTLISVSAIAFGVIALLIAGGFIEWIFWAMRESTIETGLGHIHITRPGFANAGLADPRGYLLPSDPKYLEAVRSLPSVQAIDQRLELSGLASHGDTTVAFTGEAVDPQPFNVIGHGLTVVGDRLAPDDASGVMLGRGIAAALDAKRGDRVTFIVQLPAGGINAVEGHVVGLFDTHVKSYDDSAVRIPLALGRQLLHTGSAHAWVLRLEDIDQTENAVARLRRMLPADRFQVSSWLEISDFYRKAVVLLSNQIDVMGVLIGLIIVIGISNTLTMNVLERTGEIGTLMALGIPRGGILRLFLLEGALLGIVGGVIGLICGFLLAHILSHVGIPMPPPPGRDEAYAAEIMLTPRLAISALAMAVLATAAASLYPAWRAARLPVVDALRHNR